MFKIDNPVSTSKEVSTFLKKTKPLKRGERNVVRFKKLFLTYFLRNQN